MKCVTQGNAELSRTVVNKTSAPTPNDQDKNGALYTFHSVNSAHFSLEWSRDPVEKNSYTIMRKPLVIHYPVLYLILINVFFSFSHDFSFIPIYSPFSYFLLNRTQCQHN